MSTATYTDRYLGTCKCGMTTVRTDLPTYMTSWTVKCECGKNVKLRQVFASHSETVCDARCLNAKRSTCDCSCGGANHGGGH